MSTPDHTTAVERVAWTLQRYDEPLLRRVSENMFRPRNQWPAAELVARGVAAVSNAAAVDRRLQALGPACRQLLALIGHSRQPRWRVGSLLEMLAVLGLPAEPGPVLALLDAGLLFPILPDSITRLKRFDHWLVTTSAGGPEIFAPAEITARAVREDLGLPGCPGETAVTGAVRESDGIEWPLRLAVAWQQIAAAPLRRTQSRGFFKRDLERLRGDPLLSTPPADHLVDLPDRGLLAVELALVQGLLQERDGEISAATASSQGGEKAGASDQGLAATLAGLWEAWPLLTEWNPQDGWDARLTSGSPFQSAGLLALLLLARLPKDAWATPEAIARWIVERHPFWAATNSSETRNGRTTDAAIDGLVRFLLGVAYEFRLVQVAHTPSEEGKATGNWAIRLAPLGRWALRQGDLPAGPASYPQTLLVQPNLEIVAYRQGLSPLLIAKLGQFAAWKSLGAACTLQLQPDTVYRALEAGQTFETMRRTLDQHGIRPTPPAVIESLRTWSNKRERLSVYSCATLFEFASADDLHEALARGLPATPLSDRMAVVANESEIDFRHFRLTGTRDYALPPEQCVEVAADGVTLEVDLTKSDLMLESELQQFADPAGAADKSGHRRYVLTPVSLARARAQGQELMNLEEWFLQRTGELPSPAARLLFNGNRTQPPTLQRQLVLHVHSPEIAAGLVQWPETGRHIQARLGPTALAIAEEDLRELQDRLRLLGINIGAVAN